MLQPNFFAVLPNPSLKAMRQRKGSISAHHESVDNDVSTPVETGFEGHIVPESIVHSGWSHMQRIGVKTSLLTMTNAPTGRPTETDRVESSNQHHQCNGSPDHSIQIPRERRISVFRRNRDCTLETQMWAEVQHLARQNGHSL